MKVVFSEQKFQIIDGGTFSKKVNEFLDIMICKGFSQATARSYAYDLVGLSALINRLVCRKQKTQLHHSKLSLLSIN